MASVKQPFVVHVAVLEGKRPVYVAHQKKDVWFVAAAGFTDEPNRRFRKVSRTVALRMAPELNGLLNLRVGFAAYRHGRSEPWTIEALPRGETYLITYEARPSSDNPDARSIGGAFVNCWIRSSSMDRAKRETRQHVRRMGWNNVSLKAANRMRANNLAKSMEPYFRQVQVDGSVCVFHTFPSDAPDA